MQKNDSIMELLSGYETYSTVEEINLSAASDAPASSPGCIFTYTLAAAGVSWLGGQFVGKTYDQSC